MSRASSSLSCMSPEASLSRMEGNLQTERTAKGKPSFRTHLTWPGLKLLKLSKMFHQVRVFTYQHLIHDDTQAPPIAELVVSILHEDLWSNIVRGSHSGESLAGTRRGGKEWGRTEIK